MTENQLFEQVRFDEVMLDTEYSQCTFHACDFSKTNLQRSSFVSFCR